MHIKCVDLFCGAGGASMGYHQAGFAVTGVDLNAQPRYPFPFIQADALSLSRGFLAGFDFIHASPPCQAHTALKTMHNALPHDAKMIERTRRALMGTGKPWVIENVVGAPLRDPVMLCGSMFGLQTEGGAQLHRHRIFEASFPLTAPRCDHRADADVIGIYGGHYRNRSRAAGKNREAPDFTAADGRTAMQIDWMTGVEISQAIPPAYSRWIAEQWLAQRDVRMAA